MASANEVQKREKKPEVSGGRINQSDMARSDGLWERARKVLPGGSTRAAVWFSPHPPYIVKGEGAWITDVDGHRYLDLANNLGVLIHGHAHPDVVRVVQEQVALGSCFAAPTPHEVALAELLQERVPAFERIRFINTGSEAVGLALKAAHAFTGRSRIVKLEGVYHGSNDFAEVSDYSTPENWGNEPASVAAVPATPQGVLDAVVAIAANDLAIADRVLTTHAAEIAAVIVDPVPPRAGMKPLERFFLEGLRTLTRRLGMLLIFDEVIAVRFGYHGAQGRFGGEPDLTVLGKIIGGGYPVGAVAGRADVKETTAKDVASSGTFTANPITMRAGLASMQLLTPAAFAELDALGERLRSALTQFFDEQRLPMQVSRTGSVFSFYFHRREVRDYRSYFKLPEELKRTEAFFRAMLARGVFIASTGTVFLSTVIGPGEERIFIDACKSSLLEIYTAA